MWPFSWLRGRRRARIAARPFPPAWRATLERLPFVEELAAGERRRLERLVSLCVARTSFEGCAGFEVTDEVRVTIAAQACRLILALPDDAFRRVRTVLVYPTTYAERGAHVGPGGVHSDGESRRLGEAWLRGPVVLAWDAARGGADRAEDGRNTVYHEFAHQLDLLDDFADGTPPLARRAAHEAWTRVVGREYETLRARAARGERTLLDDYGATSPAEFFAVATEAFFERPRRLAERHRELYACLRDFYRQDPARAGRATDPEP